MLTTNNKNNTCNCEVHRNSPERVGFKKWRKWNARFVSRLKKRIKLLKDMGYGDDCCELSCREYTLEENACIAAEIRWNKRNKK